MSDTKASTVISHLIASSEERMFEDIDRIRFKHKLTDSEAAQAIREAADSDLAERFLDWCEEGDR